MRGATRVVLVALLVAPRAAALASAPRSPRLWLGDADDAPPSPVVLTDAQHRHVRTVLRLKVGDGVRLFGAAMGEWTGEIVESDRRATSVGGAARTRPPPRRPLALELFFAPLRKKKRATLLIEKAVELGVTRLAPARTARTERGALDALPSGACAAAVDAAAQSERLDVPLIEAVVGLGEIATDAPLFVCAERTDGTAPRLLDALLAEPAIRSRGVALLVGPEGGLAPEDWAALGPDAVAVSLGDDVLRAETAAFAALAIAGAVLGRPPE